MGGSDLIRSESVKVVAFVKGKTNSPAELGLNSHVVTCPWTASGCRTLRAVLGPWLAGRRGPQSYGIRQMRSPGNLTESGSGQLSG